jgi:hypothetical protein
MSKLELISQSCGRHNTALEQSRSRITRGASWKKARTIMITPSSDDVKAKVMLSYACLAVPPNQPFQRMLALGQEVGEAYTQGIEAILAHPELSKWEYIATFEHDSIVPADGLLKLLDRMEQHPEFCCISGLYWVKGEGGCPQIWGDPKDPVLNFRPQPPPPAGAVVEAVGLGMGFCVFRLAMFKDPRLRRPWFVTQKGASGCATQDLYAWSDFRKNGYRGAVDASVLCGHIDADGVVW